MPSPTKEIYPPKQQILLSPLMVPLKMPLGLSHIDADFCWCDPIIALDENGKEAVIHREVMWN